MTIKLVAFDLDGTLTVDSLDVWKKLTAKYGLTQEVNEIAKKFFNNECDYETWANEEMDLFIKNGITKEKIEQEIKLSKITPGAIETLEELRKNGMKIALLSGGIDLAFRKIFPSHELFHDLLINKIADGTWIATKYGHGKYKAEGLCYLAKKYGLTLKECAFVGNDINDIETAKVAGLSIAFNPVCDELKCVSHRTITGDMTQILPYILKP